MTCAAFAATIAHVSRTSVSGLAGTITPSLNVNAASAVRKTCLASAGPRYCSDAAMMSDLMLAQR